ncbi:gamma-glutamyl hydrolase [Thraustotheca clavata]|uniref:folate gamma-glutamyl hydrolase n=1 Tax=Thraustotheca clavata TaxID=74557 RepID=A0A1V9ZGR2_9STRA|nr:gamma-glutamyl hydrolase [Thraustotheca clavata]
MVDSATLPILNHPTSTSSFSSWRLLGVVASVALVLLGVVYNKEPSVVQTKVQLSTSFVQTPNPIIGVFSQPIHHGNYVNHEYIAASYIKWIESAGGRAVRIPFTASKEELHRLISSVNGLLFPGGAATVNDQAKYLYELAIELNANGTYFPVWGTCLGFEWLVELTSQNYTILDPLDAQNISSVITFTGESSRLFSFSPYFDALTKAPLSANFHHYGITTNHFYSTPSLTSFYKALATSVDRKGVSYITAIEAKDYPFYGLQFHPEKNPYEFSERANGALYSSIDHSYEAILASQAFAHFFIREAKKNNHRFASPNEEVASTLYNNNATSGLYPTFESIYVFDPVST